MAVILHIDIDSDFNFLFWFVGKVYQERNNYILWKHNRKKKWSYEILTRIKSFGKLGKFVKKKNFVLLFISKCIYNIFIQYIDTNLWL